MNRRSFLTGIIAACAAPAVVRAQSIMRVVARDPGVYLPNGLWIPSGFASARYANCVATDDVLVRFDTTNGSRQFHVDARIPSEVWERDGLAAAVRSVMPSALAALCDGVRHENGGLAGFRAPAINLTETPFYRGEILR